jgi:hypothetical protein
MHQVLRRYWAGKTEVVHLEEDTAYQKKHFLLLICCGILLKVVEVSLVSPTHLYDKVFHLYKA